MMDDDITPSHKRPKNVSSPPTASDVVIAVGQTSPTTTTKTAITNLLDVMDTHSLLRNITPYLPNEDLMNFALTSKRTNQTIPRAIAYENRAPGTIVPVVHMNPSRHTNSYGRFEQLVQQLQRRRITNPRVFQHYQHASMMDYPEFRLSDWDDIHSQYQQFDNLMKDIKPSGPRMQRITSLDFCFSTAATAPSNNYGEIFVLYTLSHLLPSLREVNFTNTLVNGNALYQFFKNCPSLEKITYCNGRSVTAGLILERSVTAGLIVSPDCLCGIYLDGGGMGSANNLKELILDNSMLCTHPNQLDAMQNVENTADDTEEEERNGTDSVASTFMFHHCSSQVLERISLRNTQVRVVGQTGTNRTSTDTAIPQQVLLKFIRNAPPTLRWFRSNLTKANIDIVQHEHPNIEFVR